MMMFRIRNRLLVPTLLLAGLVPVAAAAGDGTAPATAAPIKADEGVVLVSVTTSSPVDVHMASLTIQRQKNGSPAFAARYDLEFGTNYAVRNTAVFSATVPAGDYRFSYGQSYGTDGPRTLDKDNMRDLGTFRVLPGKAQDLGRLILTYRAGGVPRVDRGGSALGNAELLKRVSPAGTPSLALPVVDGWLEPVPDPAAATRADEDPFWFSDPVVLRTGEMAMAGGMGTVRIRSTTGAWRSLKSPFKESFLTIAPGDGDDNLAIAAGEFDTLARIDPAGQVKRIDPGDLPAGHIVFVDGEGKAGWYVVVEQGDDIGIYHADRIDAGHWQKIRSERQSRWSDIATSFWVWPEAHGFSYATSNGWIRSLDFATGQWSETTSPDRKIIVNIRSTPEGWGVLCANGHLPPDESGKHAYPPTYFVQSFTSNDRGKSWHQVNRTAKYETAPPLPVPTGLLSIGGKQPIATTYLSSDDGATWTPSTAFYRYARITEVPQHGIFAVTPDTVLRLDPESRDWKVEFVSQ